MIPSISWSGKISDLSGELKIDIRDIARGLAHLSLLNGQTLKPYSVAQHSVLVSELCPREFSFAGLMHDAHKAYFGELSEPTRQLFDKYAPNVISACEFRLAVQVRRYFTLHPEFPACVADAERKAEEMERGRLCSSEQIEAFNMTGVPVAYSQKLVDIWSSEEAYDRFLFRFREVSPFS